jgi:manganese/zinc/iron transport system ATP- binding protein
MEHNDYGATTPAIEIENLTVAYGRRVALRNVSATIARGAFVGVIGPNGAGKSTLLKAIVGIAPARRGSIRVLGRPAREAHSHVAYVPQREAVHWDFPVTVLDVVMMGRYRGRGWLRLLQRRDRDAALDALAQVGMSDRRDEQIGRLSGGQQQRVFLARALAQDAEILLLDEPLNGVDMRTQETMLGVVERLQAAGRTVVMATHDLNMAAESCDCLCCVNHNLVAYGPSDETLTEDVLERTYGGKVLVVSRENLGGAGHAVRHGHMHDHAHEHEPAHAQQHVEAVHGEPSGGASRRPPA